MRILKLIGGIDDKLIERAALRSPTDKSEKTTRRPLSVTWLRWAVPIAACLVIALTGVLPRFADSFYPKTQAVSPDSSGAGAGAGETGTISGGTGVGMSLIPDAAFSALMDDVLADGGNNSCISPLSFKFALAMAYNGAEGDTAVLLKELFGVSPGEANAWASAYLEQAEKYDGLSRDENSPPNAELQIANSYWLREGLESEISGGFTSVLKQDYSARSDVFGTDPGPINKWVSDATNGKIEDILAKIDGGVLSYLINALYFKAQWTNDFNENLTKPGEFHNAEGTLVQTDMLHGVADSYIATPEF
jgi:serpin B